MLPLVVHSPTVDLSRFDTGLVSHISSFVGTSRELLNLALTCKSFGWRQPESDRDWSLAEEVAREAVSSGQNDIEGVRIALPQYAGGTTTWLSILHRFESPLKFDTLLGRGIAHHKEHKTSVHGTTGNTNANSTAIASNYVMESGIHYTEFQIIAGRPQIGIARPMPNLDSDRYYANRNFTFLDIWRYGLLSSTIDDEWGSGNMHLCQYFCIDGAKFCTGWRREVMDAMREDEWEGREDAQAGDTIGMLLNLEEGTLTVYKNNRRLGVMKDGLSGSYCWYTSLIEGDAAVAIKRGQPPMHPGISFPPRSPMNKIKSKSKSNITILSRR